MAFSQEADTHKRATIDLQFYWMFNELAFMHDFNVAFFAVEIHNRMVFHFTVSCCSEFFHLSLVVVVVLFHTRLIWAHEPVGEWGSHHRITMSVAIN